jgi:shikimate dehydrogenase
MTADGDNRIIKAGLVGAGIQLSSSPALHEAEGRAQQLQYSYELFDLDLMADGAKALPGVIGKAEQSGFTGLNVTFPCKQEVIPLLHELSAEARALHSVNTVLFRGGRRIGHNTDWYGFAESFRRTFADAPIQSVALIGAGGAGAAVAYAVLKLGAQHLHIMDSEFARSAALADRMTRQFPERHVRPCEDLATAMSGVDGVVHATPVGMLKLPGLAIPGEFLKPPLWVADVVYVPLDTELLSVARLLGCRTLDGSGMAVFQAAQAFELFSGIKPDTERMSNTFRSMVTANIDANVGVMPV